jgi:hypothetical protein
MTGPSVSEDDIDGLFAKLDGLDLNDNERVLLRAVLHAAADGGEASGPAERRSFSDEFAAAFKRNHAESVVAQFGSHLPEDQVIRLITRSLITRGLITRKNPTHGDE